MSAVAIPGAEHANKVPSAAEAKQGALDQLVYWREHLLEHQGGVNTTPLTENEIRAQLDKWLEKLWELIR